MGWVKVPVLMDTVCDRCLEQMSVHLCALGFFKCPDSGGYFEVGAVDRAAGFAMTYYVGESNAPVYVYADPVEAAALTAWGG